MSTEGLGVATVPDCVGSCEGDGEAIYSADGDVLPGVETPADDGVAGWVCCGVRAELAVPPVDGCGTGAACASPKMACLIRSKMLIDIFLSLDGREAVTETISR
jgi:hypothetical protein